MAKTKKRKHRKLERSLPVMRPNAGGIDIGATEIVVAVPADRDMGDGTLVSELYKTCMRWRTGCSHVEWIRWRWNRQGCTGFHCFRFWRRGG